MEILKGYGQTAVTLFFRKKGGFPFDPAVSASAPIKNNTASLTLGIEGLYKL
jgi:hypothetical protein